MRLEARTGTSRAALVMAPVGAIVVTLLICALLVACAGAPVGKAYLLLLEGGFGSRFAWSETLTRATPLILTGLAVAVAFRTRLFNIGAEGQLYLGALAAVAVGGQVDGAAAPWAASLPTGVLFGLMVAAGMLAGALLLLVPAVLKMRFGVDEVVTTLLLNFIVLLGVSTMLDGPMKDPLAMGWPQSVALVPELELARLMERSRVHSGLLIAVRWRPRSGRSIASRYSACGCAQWAPMRAPRRLRGCRWRASRCSPPRCPARWPDWPAWSRWRAVPAT